MIEREKWEKKNEPVIGSLAQNPLSVDLLSLILKWNWIRGKAFEQYQTFINTHCSLPKYNLIKKLTKNKYISHECVSLNNSVITYHKIESRYVRSFSVLVFRFQNL